MKRFRSVGTGIEVALDGSELAVLDRLGSLLSSAGSTEEDPARERLNPSIYPDDKSASREFDRLVGKERVETRSADRETFSGGIQSALTGAHVLTADEAAAWARVLGEARIVLAARGGVFEEGWPEDPGGQPEVALSMFLGFLVEELVTEMMLAMEEPDD